ncbi:MAG TPA: 1-(5-phosphoribosyl)-5-[(5-phosphoribosylamino)methylideneamino]imidazole-4-carboxamide isomerase [Solirubrobacteraceae bacterium]|nr:1-(5-phosphoribosyl)-5-[(5-phosphoribosylamino)methylideneamino]imidazole-4-carboxamide isomerase [Solirubrobacteraceae bacterium]
MRLYPAIDILEGSAVRLLKGDFEASTVYDSDPLDAAMKWVRDGARWLHVVDLDGARAGEPVNLDHLARIAAGSGVPVQYGGGLRSTAAARAALDAGAARVVIGTAAFTDPEMLDELIGSGDPERVAVGVDVRGGLVATHGWLQTSELPAREAIAALRARGAVRFIFTNIDHDGTLGGANREEVEAVARDVGDAALIFSGGIGTLEDLRGLVALRGELGLDGLEGVIVGKALYEGRFTVAEALVALAPEGESPAA